jgi:hypothetical protein
MIEQFYEARLISITHWTFAVRLNPFGMLDPEIFMDLSPEFAVGVGLVRNAIGPGCRFKCDPRQVV